MKQEFSVFDEVGLLSVHDSRHEFPTHSHDTFCISMVHQGTFGENDLMAVSGSILISHPNEIHCNQLVSDNVYGMSTFYINETVFKYSSGLEYVNFNTRVITAPKLFSQFCQLALTSPSADKASTICFDFESNLKAGINELVHGYAEERVFDPLVFDVKIPEIKAHIKKHISEKITLDSLAKIAGMNKYKFIRWFKNQIGLTPFEYIIMRRVETAKQMIKNGKPIVITAVDTGFYDQSNFSNYFKRFTGVSPKKYARACNILQDFD